jgi:hypothetical protein
MLAQEIFFLILSFIDIIMVKLIFSLLIKKKNHQHSKGININWG